MNKWIQFVWIIFMAANVSGQTHLTNPIPITVNINSGDPHFPFPQFQDYVGGKTLGRQNAIGVTDLEMEKNIREAYQIMMNRANYTGEVQDGVRYIEFNSDPTTCAGTVSEGDGYAMLAAAYMGDKKTFDGLWAYTHDHRLNLIKQYKNCAVTNRPNYIYGKNTIGFCICETFSEADNASFKKNSAADGDWDIALALLVAYRQWGTKKILTTQCGETITYKDVATEVIKALSDTVLITDGSNPPDPRNDPWGGNGYGVGVIGFDGYPKDGNNQGEATDWISNNGNPPNGRGYLWKGKTLYAKSLYPTAHFLDYVAPSYYRSFANFLTELSPTLHDWNINQFLRAEASTDWLMGQIASKNLYPFGGTYTVNRNGTLTTFSDVLSGEDSRNPWRTIMNYVWHGNPATSWDPVTHQTNTLSNTYEFNNAKRVAELFKFKNACEKLGQDPTELKFTGNALTPFDMTMAGASTGFAMNNLGNWLHGTGAASIVANYMDAPTAENFDLLADTYRQLTLQWHGEAMNNADPLETKRYIKNRPVYFHGWFRLLGLLVTTGNYQSPTFMSKPIMANVKVYHGVDKTVAYGPVIANGNEVVPGDIITHKFSYRNYASVDAKNVKITFTLPSEVSFVDASGNYSQTGNTITWTIADIVGYTSTGETGDDWKSFNPKAYKTYGEITLRVRVRSGITDKIICEQATITADNSAPHTSNEYPYNATPTFEKNCVNLLSRSLKIQKTADRDLIQNGELVNFTIDFENSANGGWLNGGRPDIGFSYAKGFSGTNSMFHYYRMFHGAQEPYINPGNYRTSYFLNDPARLGLLSATNVNGWYLNTTILEGGDPTKVKFGSELYTFGEDNFGKWNQRLITKFADTLMSTTQHTNSYFAKPGEPNNVLFVHKGIGDPYRMQVIMEARGGTAACGGSLPIGPTLLDDWSYDEGVDVGMNDKSMYFPITPSWFDYQSTYNPALSKPVTNYHVDACAPVVPRTFDRILIEEWDGYIWRRVLGTGPIPGVELNNVCVKDTLPAGLVFNGFTESEALGIKATYDPATRIITWCAPSMLPGSVGRISYSAKASVTCPTDIQTVNKAWISSSSSSPVFDDAAVRIVCVPVPPKNPKKSTIIKTSPKDSYGISEIIHYTIGFKQTDGTISNPNLSSTADWTSHCGQPMPTFPNMKGSTDTPKLITYDYSHGKNGTLITKIAPARDQPFSLVLRYNGDGSPSCATTSKAMEGLLLTFNTTACGSGTITLYQNGIPLPALTDVYFAAPTDSLNIKIVLEDDKLDLWINNFNALPYTIDNITYQKAGYVGYYNSNIGGTTNENNKMYSWYTNFDSAFDVSLSDVIPSELAIDAASLAVLYKSAGFTPDQATPVYDPATKQIKWILKSGKTPMLYGDSVAFDFNTTLLECPNGFVNNVVYANMKGQPLNYIGDQEVDNCATTTPLFFTYIGLADNHSSHNLTWSVAHAEKGKFLILASDNNLNFHEIGNVTAKSGRNNYQFPITNSDHYSYFKVIFIPESGLAVSSKVVKSNSQSAGISVYPNPFTTELYLDIKDENDYEVRIFAVTGVEVDRLKLSNGVHKLQPSLAAGVYLVQVSSAEETIHFKVVKE